jgi:hypothetical protein
VLQGSRPSEWSVGRFGERSAAQLCDLVPRALAVAVNRQVYTHHASGLASLYAYGGAWPVVYEELVNHVGGLDGVRVVRPKGKSFQLVVVNGSLVVPFRYANDLTTPLTDQRTAQRLNRTCQELLTAFGPEPSHEQGELFPVHATESNDAILGDITPGAIVMATFAANAQAGLLAVGWGEAALQADGGLSWKYHEMLPLPKDIASPTIHIEPLPLPGTRWPAGHDQGSDTRRFDDAPLPAPSLSPRPHGAQLDAGAPLSEQPPRSPLTEHDDA